VSKRDRKALEAYIREIADRLRLKHWTIRLGEDPSDEGTVAQHEAAASIHEATIWVCENFRLCHPEEQREAIVHELLHTHHEWTWRLVHTDLLEHMGRPAYNLFCDSYRRAMEYQIDALAKAFAPTVPPITWPA
jgi:hypothetical protein